MALKTLSIKAWSTWPMTAVAFPAALENTHNQPGKEIQEEGRQTYLVQRPEASHYEIRHHPPAKPAETCLRGLLFPCC